MAPQVPGWVSKTPAQGAPQYMHRPSCVRCHSVITYQSRPMSFRLHAWQYVLPPSSSWTLPVYACRMPFFRAMRRAMESVEDGGGDLSSILKSGWNAEKCIHCLTCWIYCPDAAIMVKDGKMTGINYDYCKGCGICANVCPPKTHAIDMEKERK